MVVNRRFVALALIGALVSSAALAEDKAVTLLRKSMGRKFPVNVVAVILQRDPAAEGVYQRVKVTRSADGRIRHSVLQPLRVAGVESVDNGEVMRTYLPDRRSVIVQDSAQRINADVEKRLGLARQNYVLSLSSAPRIAGRSTVCVTAEPKSNELFTRRYYLDEKTGYPLKLEVDDGKAEPSTVFHTLAIEFPASLKDGVFEMSTLPGRVHEIRYSRPQAVTSKTQAQNVVGFRPVLPDRLPMGFQVQEMQLNGGDEWRSVVVRLTDGLVRATVYQYRTEGRKVEAIEDCTSLDVNGIRFMLVSDLPDGVRQRLLQAFIAQAKADSTLRPQRLIGKAAARPSASVELASTAMAFAESEACLRGMSPFSMDLVLLTLIVQADNLQ